MAKKKGKVRDAEQPSSEGKLNRKDYERELARLHGELVKLQLWTVEKGLKVCVVFEGRDGENDGAYSVACGRRPAAMSTKPLHTQLTPTSAKRARKERRRPKASNSLKTEPLILDPLIGWLIAADFPDQVDDSSGVAPIVSSFSRS